VSKWRAWWGTSNAGVEQGARTVRAKMAPQCRKNVGDHLLRPATNDEAAIPIVEWCQLNPQVFAVPMNAEDLEAVRLSIHRYHPPINRVEPAVLQGR
jgi:hypothetical protein